MQSVHSPSSFATRTQRDTYAMVHRSLVTLKCGTQGNRNMNFRQSSHISHSTFDQQVPKNEAEQFFECPFNSCTFKSNVARNFYRHYKAAHPAVCDRALNPI